MPNNFETNEFHSDSVALAEEKGFKCFASEEGRMEHKAVKWNI